MVLYIVSHKTERAVQDEAVNLRSAAMRWMREEGFFDPGRLGFSESDVFFEDTRSDKIRRISVLGCTHYVDDLEEVLCDASFPESVTRILFGGRANAVAAPGVAHVGTWDELVRHLFP